MTYDEYRRLLAILEGIREQLDRIEAGMLKREDVNYGNLSPVARIELRRMWEAAQAGEHRDDKP